MPFPKLDLEKYDYHLPQERIAKYPLEDRDQSKLLVYKKGQITHSRFRQIGDYLPEGSSLYVNNTKVIPARLHFYKETGAHIEIFLLSPIEPTNEIASSMLAKGSSVWHCKIGNKKKWKDGQILGLDTEIGRLTCQLIDREADQVKFAWPDNKVFSELLESVGKIPLPPYLNRDPEESDKQRYQTTYAIRDGAVAAPTAGLHFTDDLLSELTGNGHQVRELTLHVSAGTFQPISVSEIEEHPMHYEQVDVSRKTIENMIEDESIISVGTTSLRTMESLYWFGAELEVKPDLQHFDIHKDVPYSQDPGLGKMEALGNILAWMDRKGIDRLYGSTGIFIVPGYRFRVVDGLITNYHLPKSTLILLIAALVGDSWKDVYTQAMSENYRFLSFGDSSLLMP